MDRLKCQNNSQFMRFPGQLKFPILHEINKGPHINIRSDTNVLKKLPLGNDNEKGTPITVIITFIVNVYGTNQYIQPYNVMLKLTFYFGIDKSLNVSLHDIKYLFFFLTL